MKWHRFLLAHLSLRCSFRQRFSLPQPLAELQYQNFQPGGGSQTNVKLSWHFSRYTDVSSPLYPHSPNPQMPPLLYDSTCQNFQLTEVFQTVVTLSRCFSRYTGVSPPTPVPSNPPSSFMIYSIRTFSLLKIFKLLSSCFFTYTHVHPHPTSTLTPPPPPPASFFLIPYATLYDLQDQNLQLTGDFQTAVISSMNYGNGISTSSLLEVAKLCISCQVIMCVFSPDTLSLPHPPPPPPHTHTP